MYTSTKLKIENYCTDIFSSLEGVGQGDILSPSRLNIFINDIPFYFNSFCVPALSSERHISCLLYADDSV